MTVGRRVRRSFGFDAAVALLCVAVETAFAVLDLVSRQEATITIAMWSQLIVADVCVLFRRRHSLLVLAVTVAASIPVIGAVAGFTDSPIPGSADPWMPAAAPIAVYSAVVYARNRTATWILVAVLAVLIAKPWQQSWVTVGTSLFMTLLPTVLGLYVAARRRLITALTDRAERAEREQLLLAEQARAEERVRLASEMHDVVSHRVSLMVLQAGALRMTTSEPATRTAAEELRSAGGQALEELRDLIGVLRTAPRGDPAPRESGMDEAPDLAALAAESEAVGVAVELVTEGNPDRVSAAVGRTVYRVVQEALTNVRKHAPGARARVRVRYGGERITVSVHNDATSAAPDPALTHTGSGTGLSGLRQRVELLGGKLHADPGETGGFTVAAILPSHVPTGPASRS
ncbi:MAG: sensor histidine kinase [Stackebrandtia sp.]